MGGNLVLDAGALIALERGSEMMLALTEYADERGDGPVIPASVLAQVWRGGPKAARLAKLLEVAEVDSLDEDRGREIGARLGARVSNDVVDAHVVCCAIKRKAVVLTSDPGDIEALTGPEEVVQILPT